MRHARIVLILAVTVCLLCGTVLAELYKWIDDEGVLHIATSIEDVPQKYRSQVTKIGSEPTASPDSKPTDSAPSTSAPVDATAVEGSLARFTVPYKNEGSARRVIIPVTFNDSVTVPMALDTGSPGMVISVDLAIRLGVFSRNNGTLFTSAGGIGGEVPAILTIIDSVSVQTARDEFVPTTVTGALSDRFAGLIGLDFLANHTISIDTREKVVVFQETEPVPGSRGGHDEAWWRQTFEKFRYVSDAWREHLESVERSSGSRSTPFAEFQSREADLLLQKLHLYASKHAVPRHWR